MNNLIKKSLIASTILFSSFTTNANLILPQATVTFGGQLATDGSGLTSQYVPSSNLLNPANGYFIETFDSATQMFGFGAPDLSYNDGVQDGCGVNSLGAAGITLSTSVNGLGVRKGSAPYAAQPGGNNPTIGDNTCFGFTPNSGGALPGYVEVDYAGFLPQGVLINYFGFYWGSVDTYNSFTFFSGNDSFTITGQQLLTSLNGTTGNQNGNGSNSYVNIAFNNGFAFDKFRVDSTGIAGEFDNIVIGLTNRQISEPSILILLAIGLFGMALKSKK